MESEVGMQGTQAADALRVAERVRADAAGIPHGHAVLQLAYAVIMSAYMAAFVYVGSDAVSAQATGGYLMALTMPAFLGAVGLMNGAGERRSGRLKPTRRYWLTVGVFGISIAVLMWWRISGGYPWWVALVSAAVTVLVFGARPVAVLRHAAAPTGASGSAPLPTAVRVTTIVMGVLLGGICATILVPIVAYVLTAFGMLCLIASMSSGPSWSLPAVGWFWSRMQWVAYGIGAVILLAVAALLIVFGITSPAVVVVCGVAIAATLTISAFFPGRGDDDLEVDTEEGAGGAPAA